MIWTKLLYGWLQLMNLHDNQQEYLEPVNNM